MEAQPPQQQQQQQQPIAVQPPQQQQPIAVQPPQPPQPQQPQPPQQPIAVQPPQPPPQPIIEPKKIGEGAYGCAFKPGINCKGQTDTDQRYITKLQSSNITTRNELEISRKIQSINNYDDHFAPIIENCPIQIGEIETKEIDNCKAIKDKTNLDINKVKYVGDYLLSRYLFKMLMSYPEKFLEIFLETHRVLLDSLKKLNEAGIIHNDIKDDNIICRVEDGRPIIIDFGLSIDNEFMKLPSSPVALPTFPIGTTPQIPSISKLNMFYFKYDTDYDIWSIEIIILNYMLDVLNSNWLASNITEQQVNEILTKIDQNNEKEKMAGSRLQELVKPQQQQNNEKQWRIIKARLETENNPLIDKIYELYGYTWRTQLIKKEEINKIVNDYTESLLKKSFIKRIPQEKIQEFKTKLSNYLLSFENKTWENLLNELIKYRESWDNYALSIVYLKLLIIININPTDNALPGSQENKQKIIEYEELLHKNILALPNERKKPEETKEEIKKVLQTIPKFEFKGIFSSINNIIASIKKQRDLLLGIAREQKESYKKEKEIYSSK